MTRVIQLIWSDWWRNLGLADFVSNYVVQRALFIVFLLVVPNVGIGHLFDAKSLLTKFVYFIPVLAFTAGLAAWDVEARNGLTWIYRTNRLAMISKLLSTLNEVWVVLLFFVALAVLVNPQVVLVILLMGLAYSLLGASIGVLFMHHDKALSTISGVVTWLMLMSPYSGPHKLDTKTAGSKRH
jgi:hypothetical protein